MYSVCQSVAAAPLTVVYEYGKVDWPTQIPQSQQILAHASQVVRELTGLRPSRHPALLAGFRLVA